MATEAVMNKWQQAFQALAPAAGKPGMGAGNQPYAPGLMASPRFADVMQNIHRSQQLASARQGMTQVTSGAEPSQVQMPPPQSQWTPEVQQHLMQYLMGILQSTMPGDQLSTTGGMTKRGY